MVVRRSAGVGVALLLAIVASCPAVGVPRRIFEGRRIFELLPEGEIQAGLIWLRRRGEGQRADAGWWQDSGLAERGLYVVIADQDAYRWDADRDRPWILHLQADLVARSGLPRSAWLLGGHGDGAQLAHRLLLALPDHWAGALLARSVDAGPLPERQPPERPRPIGVFANVNDPHVPVANLQRVCRRLPEHFPVTFCLAGQRDALGSELWELTATIAAAAGRPLRPPEDEAPAEE